MKRMMKNNEEEKYNEYEEMWMTWREENNVLIYMTYWRWLLYENEEEAMTDNEEI